MWSFATGGPVRAGGKMRADNYNNYKRLISLNKGHNSLRRCMQNFDKAPETAISATRLRLSSSIIEALENISESSKD